MQADRTLDLTNLEETFAQDREGIVEILEMALADTLERAVALEAALAGADLTLARRTAHAIKGAAANVGALELADAAAAIERSASHDDRKAAIAHFPALAPAVSRFKLAVSAYRSSF